MNILSHQVGGIALVLIYGAAFVAALANPLTKRRQEAMADVAEWPVAFDRGMIQFVSTYGGYEWI